MQDEMPDLVQHPTRDNVQDLIFNQKTGVFETMESHRPDGSASESAFHAVIVQDGIEPFLLSAKTELELVGKLQPFYGSDTFVFPYWGTPWFISRGPTRRFLISPAGSRIPLYKEEPNHEIDPTGSLSVKPK
jgi:hypothetical protein